MKMKKEIIAAIVFCSIIGVIVITIFIIWLVKSGKVFRAETSLMAESVPLTCSADNPCSGLHAGEGVSCPLELASSPEYRGLLHSGIEYSCRCAPDCQIIITDEYGQTVIPNLS